MFLCISFVDDIHEMQCVYRLSVASLQLSPTGQAGLQARCEDRLEVARRGNGRPAIAHTGLYGTLVWRFSFKFADVS